MTLLALKTEEFAYTNQAGVMGRAGRGWMLQQGGKPIEQHAFFFFFKFNSILFKFNSVNI